MKGSKFLFPALLKTLIIPPVIFALLLRLLSSKIELNVLFKIVGYISSFTVVYILRSYISVYLSTRRAKSLAAKDIPRVKGRWPLNLDILVDWAKSGSEEEVGRMMVLLSRKYGKTYNTRVLGEDQIISSNPAILKHVLLDDFDNFVKGEKFKDRAIAFLGDGIFNSDGERWKFHRTLMRPFFHPTHISPSLFIPHIQRFLLSLPIDESTFDIQYELGQLALEMAILWMTGEDLSKSSSNSEINAEWEESKNDLGPAMTEAQKIVGRRVKIGTVWPLFELTHDPLLKPMKTIRTFFMPIIDRAILRKANGDQKQEYSKNDVHLIDRLVHATEDRKLIEDQLINTLLASRDTLASCLTFCVYVLCLHLDRADKLREEIRTISPDGQVTKDVIRELRYCRAFINEVLRLYPPVPLNIRRTLRPSLLPCSSGGRPLYMPANTSIILSFILMQRDSEVWGEDVDEFKPERWMGEGLDKKEREGFMSWNFGPRMCLGQPFALTVIHTFLVLFSRHLDKLADQKKNLEFAFDAQPEGTAMPSCWKSIEGGDGRARQGIDRMWVVADVVLAIKGGLWLRFTDNGKKQ
ncbi:uncharacterized protein I206_100343 [Kwoniella pini CBS 10737]|uniref:Cytochrome P450 monooxygenase pc-2 n=1 Tax=Kwoniella pini CBS 10737 TaxID=1296096 RepID=A0A1B9IDQ3_9TREE|nr:cytochrome P450 monooxygenase pc-2 [Kwoniella pini CBS 10737]OCF53676.1 cytochrome P450 monooxygenase pc-2 [Kwoniella pini CBS 10737]